MHSPSLSAGDPFPRATLHTDSKRRVCGSHCPAHSCTVLLGGDVDPMGGDRDILKQGRPVLTASFPSLPGFSVLEKERLKSLQWTVSCRSYPRVLFPSPVVYSSGLFGWCIPVSGGLLVLVTMVKGSVEGTGG